MKIDGKIIAQSVLDSLSKRVADLHEEGVMPHLAVILIGSDESSKAYVRQKELKTQEIGAAITTHRFKDNFSEEELLTLIQELNENPVVHGIIIQRPLPSQIDQNKVTYATDGEKDIDGFRDDSPFDPPIALAVWRILKDIHLREDEMSSPVAEWLRQKKVVVLGKGVTAGLPIINYFDKREVPITVIDSKTENKDQLLKEADILISAIGKPQMLAGEMLKPGVVLIGVGMHRGEDQKLHGDYEAEDVENVAGYFTPIPGGVGPVNVAMLLSNLIKAAETS